MSKKTKKVVINKRYGGFGLSDEAYKELKKRLKLQGSNLDIFSWANKNRDDPILIEVVERLGNKANASYSKLEIIEIPADVDYEIEEDDGMEWIAEKHRTWG